MADEDVDLRLRVLYDGRGVGQARAAIAQLRHEVEGTARKSGAAGAAAGEGFGTAKRHVDATRDSMRGAGTAADQLGRQSVAATNRMEAGMGQARQAVIGLTSSYRSLAAGGIALFAFNAVKAASAANEASALTKRVFGEGAKEVERFAQNAAKSAGLARSEALRAANDFNALFKEIGVGEQEVAKMSVRFVQLAADIGSARDINVPEVIQLLRSGLGGESDALRRLGIFFNESAVKAEAMRLGLADAHGELSEGAKISARYSLILQKSSDIQGDFALTSDSVANRTRTAQAQLKDASATLAQNFLPAIADVLGGVGDLAGALNDLSPGAAALVSRLVVMGAAVAFLAPKLHNMQRAVLGGAAGFTQGSVAAARFASALGRVGTGLAIVAGALLVKGAVEEMSTTVKEMVAELAQSEGTVADFERQVRNLTRIGVSRPNAEKQIFGLLATASTGQAKIVLDNLKAQGRASGDLEEMFNRAVALAQKRVAAAQEVAGAAAGAAEATETEAEKMERLVKVLQDTEQAQRDVANSSRDMEKADRGVTEAGESLADARRELAELLARGAVDAENVAQAEDRLASADEGVDSASQRVADARRELGELLAKGAVDAERVAEAERGVADAARATEDAHRRLVDAEERLAEARRGATADEITDKELALNAARRGAQQAPLDVQEAEKRLLDARRRGDPEAMRQAELDLAAARDGVIAADIRVRDAEADLAETRAKGGEGTREVVDAERGVVDARQAVADALRGQTEAQEELDEARAGDPDFARNLADAERAVADAERGVAQATKERTAAALALNEAKRGDPDFGQDVAEARRRVEAAERAVTDALNAQAQSRVAHAQNVAAQQVAEAALRGEIVNAQQAHELYIRELDRLRDTTAPGSPLRRHLDEMISELANNYSRTFSAVLLLDTEEARAKMRALYDEFSIPARFRWGAGMHEGGSVPGSGRGDTVPAMLEPGEYVVSRRAVERLGVDALNRLNRMQAGGLVGHNWAAEAFRPDLERMASAGPWAGGTMVNSNNTTMEVHPSPAMDEAALAEKVWRRVSFYKAR